MYNEPMLSEREWALIVELLECEQNDLPSEIHHTRSSSVRTELQERLALARGILEHLREPALAESE
jgi:hypothetical protein